MNLRGILILGILIEGILIACGLIANHWRYTICHGNIYYLVDIYYAVALSLSLILTNFVFLYNIHRVKLKSIRRGFRLGEVLMLLKW